MSILVATVVRSAAILAQPAAQQYGAESPQAVVAALQKPIAADDLSAATAYIAPTSRQRLAEEVVGGVIVALDMYDPNTPVVVGPKPTKAELDARRKSFRAAQDIVRAALKPHGLDSLVGVPTATLMSDATPKTIAAAVAKADTVVLVRHLMAAFAKIEAMLQMEKSNVRRVPLSFGAVSSYQVIGDDATARAGAETLQFERVQGRWYIAIPAK